MDNAIYFLTPRVPRLVPPRLTAFHLECHHGTCLSQWDHSNPWSAPKTLSLNTYSTPSIFINSGHVVVSEVIAERLKAVTACRLVDVLFDRCYCFPFAVNDIEYESSSLYRNSKNLRDFISRLCDKFPSPPPDVPYYAVIPFESKNTTYGADGFHWTLPTPDDYSYHSVDFFVNVADVLDNGIVKNRGFLMSHDAAQCIANDINSDFEYMVRVNH